MFNQQRASLELRTANTQISMRSSVKGIQQLHKRIHNVLTLHRNHLCSTCTSELKIALTNTSTVSWMY